MKTNKAIIAVTHGFELYAVEILVSRVPHNNAFILSRPAYRSVTARCQGRNNSVPRPWSVGRDDHVSTAHAHGAVDGSRSHTVTVIRKTEPHTLPAPKSNSGVTQLLLRAASHGGRLVMVSKYTYSPVTARKGVFFPHHIFMMGKSERR